MRLLITTGLLCCSLLLCAQADTIPGRNLGAAAGAGVGTEAQGRDQRYKVKLTGGINVGGELYGISGTANRRSPWSYATTGRLGISVGKFRLPISFTYRDRQFAYDFTFNRFGMSPTLGWATLHLGWRNMSFSPYTLAGRTFFGVGTELRPGKLYVGGLYGTIQNPLAIRDSLTFGANLIPIFDRKLYGAKVGYRNGKHHVEVMAAKVWDDVTSFDYPARYDERGYRVLTPKENVVAGLNAGFEIAKTVELYFKTGVTAFTNDLDDPLTETISGSIPDQYENFVTINSSTRATFAGDAGLNVTLKGTKVGLQYRRVEPFYTTLAATYFNNDVEQYTGLLTTAFAERKILFNGRIGLERNNLRGYRANDTRRLIANATVAYKPTDDWNVNLRYTNFTTEADNAVLELNDTLRFVSVSNNGGISASRRIGGKTRDVQLSLFTNYQLVTDQSLVDRLDELESYAGTLSAAVRWKETGLFVTPSLQYYRYNLSDRNQERFGLGVNVGKAFWGNRLNAGFSSTLSQNDINGLRDGATGQHGLRLRYKMSKKASVSLSGSYRHVASVRRRSFREWRTNIRYGLRL